MNNLTQGNEERNSVLNPNRSGISSSEERGGHLCRPAYLSELLKGEPVAGFGQLLDDLSDLVSRQSQVSSPEELIELLFADEAVAVHVW